MERQWNFIADMNYSGEVTISDIWLWFEWLYFYPGDLIFNFIIENMTWLATFFEINSSSYGGIASGVISFIMWLIVWGILNLFSGELPKDNRFSAKDD